MLLLLLLQPLLLHLPLSLLLVLCPLSLPSLLLLLPSRFHLLRDGHARLFKRHGVWPRQHHQPSKLDPAQPAQEEAVADQPHQQVLVDRHLR